MLAGLLVLSLLVLLWAYLRWIDQPVWPVRSKLPLLSGWVDGEPDKRFWIDRSGEVSQTMSEQLAENFSVSVGEMNKMLQAQVPSPFFHDNKGAVRTVGGPNGAENTVGEGVGGRNG